MRSAASLLLAALALVGCTPNAQEALRPNVILVMADDQGWEEVGYNGHPILHTPVLDEMARGGLRFDRFYAATPTCGPTRGSVMTGRHPTRFGLFGPGWAMRPEETTLASILRQAGYRTGHFGKWHLGPVKAGAPNNPGASGFDEWLSHDNFFGMDPGLARNGAAPEPYQGESSRILVDEAIRFIERAVANEEPFLAVVWFGTPHGPNEPLPEDRARYAGRVSDRLADRYAEITAMDRAIGVLREGLRGLGVANDTLIWFCSDNGPKDRVLYQPALRGSKGTLFEGGVRVPGIIEWPAHITEPRSTDVTGVTTDMLPTLLDLMDLPLPDRPLDGVSLRLLLKGEMSSRPAPLFFWKYNSRDERNGEPWIEAELQKGNTPTWKNPGIEFLNFAHPIAKTSDFGGTAAVIADRYKLILLPRQRPMLFDIVTDSGETNDLYAQHPTIAKAMTDQLRAWQASVEVSLTGADYRD